MKPAKRRGFLLADVMVGLAVTGLLAGVLATAMYGHQRAATKLAARRQALRTAEQALLLMQAGDAAAARMAGVQLRPAGGAGSVEVPGYRWVQVRATCDEQSATLLGLIPASTAVEGGGK